jgi:glycine oxidase
MPDADHGDVIVAGGGVIGLGVAWRCALRGLRTTVVDDQPGQGASWAAAGMLAPVSEMQYGEGALLRLTLEGAHCFASFIAELEAETGLTTGYRPCGTVIVALDADDNAVLEELFQFQRRMGMKAERLTGRQCRDLEPMLAPGVRGGVHIAQDHQVDNRLFTAALTAAARGRGVTFRPNRVADVLTSGGRVHGARLDDGATLTAGTLVVSAGCRSGDIADRALGAAVPVRPVKGQILRLRVTGAPLLARTVRGLVRGSSLYLVPRTDGGVVLGATVEDRGFDTRITAGGVYQLLRDAAALVPGVDELELVECRAGLRPGTPDNAPILGTTAVTGLLLATGHYRNGVLLTPVTAASVASLIVTGRTPEIIAPFAVDRFAAVGSAA